MSNFNNEARAKQLISFEGMKRRGNLAPTDIDGFTEYNGKVFIYFEGKVIGTRTPVGQELAYTNICESYYEPNIEFSKLKHIAWVLIFEHNTHPDETIIMKDQYVTNVCSSLTIEWRTPQSDDVIPKFILDSNGNITVLEALKQIEDWCYANDIKIGR